MFIFKSWREFWARWNEGNVRDFIKDVAETTEQTLRERIKNPPKTGRKYGSHQASAPGEYPANETGTLESGIRKKITARDATVGTTDMHGFFLREGTVNMAPRKMSDAAMKEALPTCRARMKHFAEWRRKR